MRSAAGAEGSRHVHRLACVGLAQEVRRRSDTTSLQALPGDALPRAVAVGAGADVSRGDVLPVVHGARADVDAAVVAEAAGVHGLALERCCGRG